MTTQLIQEEICTSRGVENRYQVMALDESDRPARYRFTNDSPVNRYALVDMSVKGHYECLEKTDAQSYDDAVIVLMESVRPIED